MKFHLVELTEKEKFRLRLMDAYFRMKREGRVNVRYLCRLMGVHHSTFYRLKKQFNRLNLTSIKYKSRKPKSLKSLPWGVVVEICEWRRLNPSKSHYYLYQSWLKEERKPPCCPKTIYNWWKKRGLIVTRHRRKRVKSKLFNQAKLPGELVQIDTKFLPRKKYQYTAIDVVSKWRYLEVYPKLTQSNSVDFINKFLH